MGGNLDVAAAVSCLLLSGMLVGCSVISMSLAMLVFLAVVRPLLANATELGGMLLLVLVCDSRLLTA
jgi:hypothetical protein